MSDHYNDISDDVSRDLRRATKTNLEVFYSRQNKDLSSLFDKYGSDKSSNNEANAPAPYPWPAHTYADVYTLLMKPVRRTLKSLLEVGIGTNNNTIPSNMTETGIPGASLRAWRDYFPNATIIGLDIDKNILFNEERIKTYYCDQTDNDSINKLFKMLRRRFDIIIDDGLHTFEAGTNFFEKAFDRLKVGGMYFIEDVKTCDLLRYREYFNDTKYDVYYLRLHRDPIPIDDNNVLIVLK